MRKPVERRLSAPDHDHQRQSNWTRRVLPSRLVLPTNHDQHVPCPRLSFAQLPSCCLAVRHAPTLNVLLAVRASVGCGRVHASTLCAGNMREGDWMSWRVGGSLLGRPVAALSGSSSPFSNGPVNVLIVDFVLILSPCLPPRR